MIEVATVQGPGTVEAEVVGELFGVHRDLTASRRGWTVTHLRRDKDVRELAPGGQAEPGAVEERAEDDHGEALHNSWGIRAMNNVAPLKAPFIWFGGKRRVADIVWRALGDVDNYVEPFAGSLAVLLGRPAWHTGTTETVNDADMYLANFWRALQADPDAVAYHADWPVNEADLFARHLWLVNEGLESLRQGLEADPEWFDARIAGWWVWGLNSWIGSGWCSGAGPWQLPHLGNRGQGVNRQLPHLGNRGADKPGPRLASNERLHAYMGSLAERLRRVRVCCGDWSRIVTNGALAYGNTVGVFLDPPYTNVRTADLYTVDDFTVAIDVAAWCRENGDNPRYRIVLCGYEGEHDLPGWRVYRYSASAAYQTTNGGGANAENRHRECLWFSPHCVDNARQASLFEVPS